MAVVDSLEVDIQAKSESVNKSLDGLVRRMGLVAEGISAIGNNKGLSDFAKKAQEATRNLSGIQNIAKDVSARLEPQMQKVAKDFAQITEKYKDLGKGFSFKGSAIEVQKQIDRYTNSLEAARLKKEELEATGKTEGKAYETAVAKTIEYANVIKSLEQQLVEMKSVRPQIDVKISGIEEAEQKISSVSEKIKSVSIPETAFNYNADAMKAVFGKMAEGVENWSQAVEKFGENAGDVMNKTLPQISEQSKKLSSNLLKVKTSTESAGDGIRKSEKNSEALNSSLKKLETSTNSLSKSMSGLGKNISKAFSGIKSFTKQILSAVGIIGGFYAIIRGVMSAINISSSLVEVQNVVDTTFKSMSYKVEDFSKTSIKEFGMSELALKKISSRFQAMGTAMGFPIDRMSDMSLNLTRLAADMASFYNVAQEDVAKSLESIFTGMTRPLRQYGLDLTQATLQEWALKQGLDADIQSMSQAEKTLLRYKYVLANTGAAQGDFARTANTWANQVRILKQNFQQLASVIGGVLVNAFKPLIQTVNTAMSRIIALAQTISNALGKIFGWMLEKGSGGFAQDFEDAADAAGNIAGGLSAAEKAGKKLRTYLLAIDELNVADTDKDDAGAGGGAGDFDGIGGTNLGKWISGESIFGQFQSKLDNLYKLGKYIGDKFSESMEHINWNKVYEKARNFGTGLADFLNGLISPRLFGNVGKTIAGSLNAAIYSALSFGETFDWKNFGLSIAAGINNFFKTFDFASLAKTLNAWAQGILNTAIEAVKNTDWGLIGENIGIFLKKIDLWEVGKGIVKLLWEGIQAGFKLFANTFKEAPIKTLLISIIALPSALKSIASSKIIASIANLANKYLTFFKNIKLATTALTGNKASLSLLSTAYPKIGKAIDTAGKAFANFRLGIENGNFLTGLNEGFKTISNSLTGFQKGTVTALAGIAEFSIVSDIFRELSNGSEKMSSGIAKIGVSVAAAGAAMAAAFGPAGFAFSAVVGITAAVKGINDSLNDLQFSSMFEAVKNSGVVPLESLGNVAKDAFEKITSGVESSIEKLNSLSQTKESIAGIIESITNIKTAIDSGAYSIAEKVPQIVDQFKTLLSESKLVLGEEYDVIIENVVGAWADVLMAQGQTIPDVVAGLLDLKNKGNEAYAALEEDLQSLIKAYEEESISAEEFYTKASPLFEQIKNLNAGGEINDVAKAVEELGGALDLSKYISKDSFDTSGFSAYMDTVVQKAKDGKDNLQTLGEENAKTIADWKAKLDALGVDASNYDWASLYGANEAQVTSGISTINSAYQDYADQVQYGLVELLPKVVKDATDTYENLGWQQKLFTTKADFVQGEIDKFTENILNPATKSIEEGFEQFGLDGEVWAGEAAKKLIDSLFSTVTESSYEGVEITTTTLKNNWKDILENALDGAADAIDAKGYGERTVDSYTSGIEDRAQDSKDAIKKWMEEIDKAVHDGALEFGSPSKKMIEYGADTVTGYVSGIEQNKQTALDSITAFANSLREAFKDAMSSDLWGSSFEGMLQGFKLKWEELSAWWKEEAIPAWMEENVVPWFSEETWFTATDGMKTGIAKKWDEFVKLWKTNITKWWNTDVSQWFTAAKWAQFGTNMKNGLYSGFKGIVAEIGGIMNGIVDVFNQGLNNITRAVNSAITQFNAIASQIGAPTISTISAPGIEKVKIPQFQMGGFPEDGLFYANHNELVGEFTNGRTAVANNEMIVEGIKNGVRDAVAEILAPYLADIAQNTRETADKDTSVVLEGRETVDWLRQQSDRMGVRFAY